MTKQAPHYQSPIQKALAEALKKRSARIGLFWIKLLAVCAVFAPLFANTVPLFHYTPGGGVSLPFLRYISIEDVIFIGGFFSALLCYKFPLKFGKSLLLWLGSMILIAVLAVAFVKPPKLIDYESFRQTDNAATVVHAPIPYSPKDYLRDYGNTSLEAPLASTERTHLMGTDDNGADVASRMIHASRIALSIGFVATGLAMVIGVFIGGFMGYHAGKVDMLGMRLVEIFEAIPVLFLLLTFVAFFGSNLYIIMIIIGITGWSGYARYLRAEFLKLRGMEYIQAAIACGIPLRSVLFKHMLPNGLAPLLVAGSFGVASAILAEATLSFLGLGLVNEPSWGALLNQAIQSSVFNWWMAAFPGGAIFFTVFSYNLIGEALRDAIDPTLQKEHP